MIDPASHGHRVAARRRLGQLVEQDAARPRVVEARLLDLEELGDVAPLGRPDRPAGHGRVRVAKLDTASASRR